MDGLRKALDAIRGVRVAVVGDVMLDRYVHGSVERVSPEAPVPVFAPSSAREMPGGAGNVAMNLRALGAAPRLVACIGDDDAGRRLRDLLPHANLIVAGRTTVKERLVAGQQIVRIDRDHAVPDDPRLLDAAIGALEGAQSVVLADYGKGVVGAALIARVTAVAKRRPIPVVVDPWRGRFSHYRGATVLTPNEREFIAARGAFGPDAMLDAVEELDLQHLAVTRGAEGIALASKGRVRHFEAERRRVFDVAGAGDSVTAALGAALGAGLAIETAVGLANVAAGLAVEKRGTATVGAAELRAAAIGPRNKLTSLPDLLFDIEDWRRRGCSIGFANGVFDLLHPGHLALLAQARDACDRLIVGLNSDASTRSLKGPGRPIQDEQARAAVLSALPYVDRIVLFDEATPEKLVEAVAPDLLAKGADHSGRDIAGAALVEARGGRVLLVELLAGRSTSGTVARACVA